MGLCGTPDGWMGGYRGPNGRPTNLSQKEPRNSDDINPPSFKDNPKPIEGVLVKPRTTPPGIVGGF